MHLMQVDHEVDAAGVAEQANKEGRGKVSIEVNDIDSSFWHKAALTLLDLDYCFSVEALSTFLPQDQVWYFRLILYLVRRD